MIQSLQIPASGIQNLFLNPCFNSKKELFTIQFGQREIKMHPYLADILSPTISKMHASDPSASTIIFENEEDLFTEEMINIISNLSKGQSVSLNSETAYKLRFFSILLENEDLYRLI